MAHDHSHDEHHHGTDLKAALMGLFGAIVFLILFVYGVSRWTSSLFAGHG